MSFLSKLFPSFLAQGIGDNNTSNSLSNLNNTLNGLNSTIQTMSDKLQENDFVFINSAGYTLNVNQSANTQLLLGVPVPVGYRATIKDFNVNFNPSGGSVNLVVTDFNGKNTLGQVATNISSSASGFGATVIDEGQCLAVQVNSQGNGLVSVYISGVIVKKLRYV